MSAQGQPASDAFMRRWLSQAPSTSLARSPWRRLPTLSRGIDAFSFSCAGAPAFSFSSASWEYETYIWHTDLDTFDKVVIDDVRSNAIVLAMLAIWRRRIRRVCHATLPQILRFPASRRYDVRTRACGLCLPPTQSASGI